MTGTTLADSAALCDRAAVAVRVAAALVTRSAVAQRSRLRVDGPAHPAVADEGVVLLSQSVTAVRVGAVRQLVKCVARNSGLAVSDQADFVLAVQELVTNAIRHGGGRGRLVLRLAGDCLVCSVTDTGAGFAGLPAAGSGPPPAGREGGRGLFLIRQLTQSAEIINGATGCTVTITMLLPSAAS
ncbi:ATP-binding protein [Actinoplanes sp. NPDC049596]|uniref:ATP-binding protein n=1 Tax=unclassified Actinoplanes TaxID=2626549 RepID=UPI00343CF8BF